MKKTAALILIFSLILFTLCGCESGTNQNSAENQTESATSAKTEKVQFNSDMFTNRDFEVGYDESSSIAVKLNGEGAVCDSDSVKISGGTITLTKEATYIVSGTLNNGMIIVNAPKTAKLQIVLNKANITSKTSAALYVLSADKVFVTLADGTENTLANGGSFTAIDDNNIDAAVFSKQDITFNGSGSLKVTSPAGHGIVCNDDLVLTGGTYTVNSASHGIKAKDSVRVANASITAESGKDGIHAENSDDTSLGFVYISSGTFKINAQGDSVSAGTYLQIDDGSFDLTAGGGYKNGTKASSESYGGFMGKGGPEQKATAEADSSDDSTSMKGLKAGGNITIAKGTINVDSADDSIHSNSAIAVKGGSFTLASGDDGIHADEKITITAGTIKVTQSYEGIEALNIAISGGDINIKATDDGINAAGGKDSSGSGGRDEKFGGNPAQSSSSNGTMAVSGGTIYINAGGDGLDSNGSLSITGGSVTICGPNVGDTSIIDFDTTGKISGGTFIGTGASGMAQNFSTDSTQGVIMVLTGKQSSGTEVKLTDSDGNVIISVTPKEDYSCVILSKDSIVKGKTYKLTAGSYSESITMDSTVYGESQGMAGGAPGAPGGMKPAR